MRLRRSHRTARVACACLLAGGALALGACGSNDDSHSASGGGTVDSASIESAIKKDFSSSANPVSTVKCPTDVKAEDGATFTCDVTWENEATGEVKVTESGRTKFTYTLVSGSVKVPGSELDKTLEAQLAAQGAPDATVNCPETVTVKLNSTVTCDVTSAGGGATGTVSFTFTSDTGEVDSSSVQGG